MLQLCYYRYFHERLRVYTYMNMYKWLNIPIYMLCRSMKKSSGSSSRQQTVKAAAMRSSRSNSSNDDSSDRETTHQTTAADTQQSGSSSGERTQRDVTSAAGSRGDTSKCERVPDSKYYSLNPKRIKYNSMTFLHTSCNFAGVRTQTNYKTCKNLYWIHWQYVTMFEVNGMATSSRVSCLLLSKDLQVVMAAVVHRIKSIVW